MSICPIMTAGADNPKNPQEQVPCIVPCELRIGNECAIKILAKKAIYEVKHSKSDTDNVVADTNDSTR